MAQQKPLGSFVTEFGKRRSVHVARKKSRRWICNDVWMDILPHFRRRQLGLKMALLSHRFEALVDTHFDGQSELTIWRHISIFKDIAAKVSKLSVIMLIKGNSVQFPLPDRPLRSKIRFKDLRIEYIDHSVITFLRANQQIWDKGTDLDLQVPYPNNAKEVQPIWTDFTREIWPIFVPNIRHLSLSNGRHLDNLRRLTSSTILSNLNQLISIHSDYLLPDAIGDDGPNATAGQALAKWLHTPGKDGKPKRFRCSGAKSKIIECINNFKEAFLRATISSASYIIRFVLFGESTPIEPFELMNGRTNEMLTLAKEDSDENAEKEYGYKWQERWVMKRCQIVETIQWEDKKTDNLNTVKFQLYEFGPLSPPKAGKKNTKSHQKMSAGPSGQRKKK